MRNVSQWKPTKIRRRGDRFSVDPGGVGPGSLYITMAAFRILSRKRDYLGGHLADLGCGDVPLYEWYRDRVDRVTCIDWPETGHSRAHVDVCADLNEPLPLRDASVDCILLTSVLEHIRSPRMLFGESARILAGGGCLVVNVPFLYHLHEEPYDYHRYTRHCLEHMAGEAGLEVVSLEHYGNAFGVLVDVGSKVAEAGLRAVSRGLPAFAAAGVRFLGFGCIRLFQKVSFLAFGRGWVCKVLEGSHLSRGMPLGYVGVFRSSKGTRAGGSDRMGTRECVEGV